MLINDALHLELYCACRGFCLATSKIPNFDNYFRQLHHIENSNKVDPDKLIMSRIIGIYVGCVNSAVFRHTS